MEENRIMRYRKKPVVIEAIKFHNTVDGKIIKECIDFCGGDAYLDINGTLAIETLEGTINASDGDMIIRGIAGEYYPCKPGIFEQTYERID